MYHTALAVAEGVGLAASDSAATGTVALGREDPVTRRVADVDSAVRARDTVLVAAAPLARRAGEGGGGQKADGDEDTSEVHFVLSLEENLDFLFEL
jgi:hypothetical protein